MEEWGIAAHAWIGREVFWPLLFYGMMRAAAQNSGSWKRHLGRGAAYQVTGHRCSTAYTITKLMWGKKHWPEVYGSTHRVPTAKDVIVYKLTGRMCTDYSDACGYMAYDYARVSGMSRSSGSRA